MYPQTHFLFSFLIGLIFVSLGIGGINYQTAILIGLAGMLIDIDHFIVYIIRYKYKDFSVKHAFNRAVTGLYKGRSFIHHQIGFLIMTLIILRLYTINLNWFYIIGLGYYSHMFLDYAHLNILKIKGDMKIKEAGFIEKISKFEIMLDIFLVLGILLLMI